MPVAREGWILVSSISGPVGSRHCGPLSSFDSTFNINTSSTSWGLVSVIRSVVPNSLWPHGLQPTRLLCPWEFPGNDTGVGCYFLHQGIFPTQGSNPGFLHCRQILYRLSYKGSWSLYPEQNLIQYRKEFSLLLACSLSLFFFLILARPA